MKQKKKLNQTSFLLLITIVLFFVMYAIGCVIFKEQGLRKDPELLKPVYFQRRPDRDRCRHDHRYDHRRH